MRNKMNELLVKVALKKEQVFAKLSERTEGESNYIAFFVLVGVVCILAGVIVAAAKVIGNTATNGIQGMVENVFTNILK